MDEFVLMVLGILLIAVMHELGHVVMAICYGYFKKVDLSWLNFTTVLNHPVPLNAYIVIGLTGIAYGIATAFVVSRALFPENFLADFFFVGTAIFLSLADLFLLALVYNQKRINPFFKEVPEKFSWDVKFHG